MSTTITDIGVHRPPGTALEDLAPGLGLTETDVRRFRRAFGFRDVAADPAASEADLLVAALRDLTCIEGIAPRVRWVLRARTVRSSESRPDNALEEACRRTGLEGAVRLTVGDHACASGLYCVALAQRLLAEDPDGLAVVLAGEKTFTPESRVIPGVALLGEATAAAVLARDGDGPRVLGYAGLQRPIEGSGLVMTAQAGEAFAAAYAPDVDTVVGEALGAAGLTTADVDVYVPHNVAQVLSVRTARRWGLEKEQVYAGTIAEVGHCWSADPFLNLRAAREEGMLQEGGVAVLTSVGIGASFGALVVRC